MFGQGVRLAVLVVYPPSCFEARLRNLLAEVPSAEVGRNFQDRDIWTEIGVEGLVMVAEEETGCTMDVCCNSKDCPLYRSFNALPFPQLPELANTRRLATTTTAAPMRRHNLGSRNVNMPFVEYTRDFNDVQATQPLNAESSQQGTIGDR